MVAMGDTASARCDLQKLLFRPKARIFVGASLCRFRLKQIGLEILKLKLELEFT
jgi:hypothetical protein